jgi:hypothetical protein
MGLKQLFLLLAGLGLLSLASPGYAFDYKTYPGSLCQPSSGHEAVDFIRGPGFIYNTNVQQPRLVTCPITRDRVPHEGQTGERTQLQQKIAEAREPVHSPEYIPFWDAKPPNPALPADRTIPDRGLGSPAQSSRE